MIRRILPILLSILVVAPACDSGADEHERTIRAALKRTASVARSFVYTDASGGGVNIVQGIFEDDYRYKAQVALGRQPILEQVVRDDVLALRFLDPLAAETLLTGRATPLSQPGSTGPGSAAPIPAAGAVDALRSGRWVIDQAGAPELVSSALGERRQIGDNPLLDGVTALAYVERAIDEADRIVRFNKEASDYRPQDDTFPIPDGESNVVRYDFVAPELPRPLRQGEGTATGGTLQTSHFRRMGVYIKEGRVVEVREEIGALRRHVKHLIEFYDIKVSQDEDIRKTGPAALRQLNVLREGAGTEPIRQRSMTLEMLDFEKVNPIELPADVIEGNLSFFFNLGQPAERSS